MLFPMRRNSVNAIVLSEDKKKILLIKRRDVPLWVIPGGAIDEGESPEDAVLRELQEETGCHTAIVRKVCVYLPINRLTGTVHVFTCKVVSGAPKTGSETGDIGFFDLDRLPRPFFHVHKEMIQDAFDETSDLTEKKLTQVTYTNLFIYFLRHPLRVFRFALSQLGFPINT